MDHTLNAPVPIVSLPVRSRPKASRDPYDALRLWSALTHGAGAVLALPATALLLYRAALAGRMDQLAAFAVYGLSMILLYTASTLYHCLRISVPGRRWLRKADHCSICLLIAGSYTPFCLLVLDRSCGLPLLGAVWGFALAGIALSIAWICAPRWLTAGIYLLMGWLVLFAIGPLSRALPPDGMAGLAVGGVLYSIGGVLYALKWPGRSNPRFGCHEIFHLFILLGSICHFWVMCRVADLL